MAKKGGGSGVSASIQAMPTVSCNCQQTQAATNTFNQPPPPLRTTPSVQTVKCLLQSLCVNLYPTLSSLTSVSFLFFFNSFEADFFTFFWTWIVVVHAGLWRSVWFIFIDGLPRDVLASVPAFVIKCSWVSNIGRSFRTFIL